MLIVLSHVLRDHLLLFGKFSKQQSTFGKSLSVCKELFISEFKFDFRENIFKSVINAIEANYLYNKINVSNNYTNSLH